MKQNPLVSIIVPTKNNERTIERCLRSCVGQTYENVEVLMVDNHSTDRTPQIAEELGVRVITFGPERNLQRPKGAEEANGDFLLFLDSDMYLSPTLVEHCINRWRADNNLKAFIVPEISIGHRFWTRCKVLERGFYRHYEPLNTARLIERQAYEDSGGWDPSLISGEDFDLHERLKTLGIQMAWSQELIEHDDGEIRLWSYLKKKFYYGRFLTSYLKKSHQRSTHSWSRNLFFLRRCLYTNPRKIFAHPFLYIGMFFLLSVTQVAYICGMIREKSNVK